MTSADAIQTNRLGKRYGAIEAVHELSLTVPMGTVTGFLGQNGAGKSTLLKILLGIVRPSSGSGTVLGLPIDSRQSSLEIRRRVAFVAEDKRLYEYMTVKQIINFVRPLFPLWDVEMERKLSNEFNLPADRKIKKLSKGMRTQLGLLLGICRGAELLILDEPTEGLDPVATEKVLELIVSMVSNKTTVFFSSHQIHEVEQIAEHICIIHKGRLLVESTIDQLKENYRRIKFVFDSPMPESHFGVEGVLRAVAEGRTLTVVARGNVEQIIQRGKALQATAVDVLPLTLKDIFLEHLKVA